MPKKSLNLQKFAFTSVNFQQHKESSHIIIIFALLMSLSFSHFSSSSKHNTTLLFKLPGGEMQRTLVEIVFEINTSSQFNKLL